MFEKVSSVFTSLNLLIINLLGHLFPVDARVDGGQLLAVDDLRLLEPLVTVGEGDRLSGTLDVAELSKRLEVLRQRSRRRRVWGRLCGVLAALC